MKVFLKFLFVSNQSCLELLARLSGGWAHSEAVTDAKSGIGVQF